jgi:hypothetical protein
MKSTLVKKSIFSIIMTLIVFTIYVNTNKNFYIEKKTISLNDGSKNLLLNHLKNLKDKNNFLGEKYKVINKNLGTLLEENRQILSFMYFDLQTIKLKIMQFGHVNGITFRENLNFLNYSLENTLLEEGSFIYSYYTKRFENEDKNSSDEFENLFHEYFYENNYKMLNKLKKNNDLIININDQVISIKELNDYNNSIASFKRAFEEINYNIFDLSKENYYPFYQNKFYVLIIIQIFSYLFLSQIFLFKKKN